MYDPFDDAERLRFARYLARVSVATRAIGLLALIGAFIFFLIALSLNSSSDRIGFSLMALFVALMGILVWGTGVFHGAIGRTIPTVVRIDRGLSTLAERVSQPGAPLPGARAPALLEAPAPAPAPTSEPAAETAADAISTPASPEPRRAVATPEPEPARTPCPHCGGLIHPEATRCVHCMRKVAR